MVQGYKFAVFYPDLIDRSQTPNYQLLPDPDGAKYAARRLKSRRLISLNHQICPAGGGRAC